MIIEDGKGTGNKAEVNTNHHLKVIAVGTNELQHTTEEGDAYIWCFTGYDYDAADTIMYVQNDDPNYQLTVDQVQLYCDTASKVQIHCPTKPTTPAGTAITCYNLNRTSGNTALATAYQDETGNTQGTIFINVYIAANGVIDILSDPGEVVILGYHDCIGVDIVTAGTMAYGYIIGHYHKHH